MCPTQKPVTLNAVTVTKEFCTLPFDLVLGIYPPLAVGYVSATKPVTLNTDYKEREFCTLPFDVVVGIALLTEG